MSRADWCVINYGVQPNRLECKRCGVSEEMCIRLPAPVHQFTGLLDGFIKRHSECVPRNEPKAKE